MSTKKSTKKEKQEPIVDWSTNSEDTVAYQVKASVSTVFFLFNNSEREICVDGVGVLPPGKNVQIPRKVLERILADEKGLKKINVSVVG